MKRQVGFGWGSVEEASSYDIEVKSEDSRIKLRSKTNKWKGDLEIGHHNIRIRSRDSRGVPGDWSEWMPLTVKASKVIMTTPTENTEIKSLGLGETEVRLAWKKLGHIKNYILRIKDDLGETYEHEVSDNWTVVDLPIGRKYSWNVIPDLDSLKHDPPLDKHFRISGGQLTMPQIDKIDELMPIQHLSWSQPKHATKYYAVLLKRKGQKWSVFKTQNGLSSPSVDFDAPLESGDYQIRVRAEAPQFANSEFKKVRFTAFTSRKPASIDTIKLKKRPRKDFYWILRYMATTPKYSSINQDTTVTFDFDKSSPLAGTGELGFGYDSIYLDWSALLLINLSGFTSKNANNSFDLFNYIATEIIGGWKFRTSEHNLFKPLAGIFYKELPLMNGQKINGVFLPAGSERIAFTGLMLGLEYTGHITSALGYRSQLKTYTPLATNSTTNGQSVKSDLSYEAGLMVSYQLTSRSTGYIGYTYRDDNIRYPAVKRDGFNSVKLQGHYLNLVIESDY